MAESKISKPSAKYISFGNFRPMETELNDYWQTIIPNSGEPVFVELKVQYGACYGFMNRYDGAYGSGVVARYNGEVWGLSLDNGTVRAENILVRHK